VIVVWDPASIDAYNRRRPDTEIERCERGTMSDLVLVNQLTENSNTP